MLPMAAKASRQFAALWTRKSRRIDGPQVQAIAWVRELLDDEETIAQYLSAALEDPNPDVLLVAIRDVARPWDNATRWDAGLGRESLYKALTPDSRPRYDTVLRVVHAVPPALRLTMLWRWLSKPKFECNCRADCRH